ncbi:gametogenetin-binding protein 2-like isoform X2 [Tubulanus polymorphus]|uniref:gametogenetin-binding protein 2-like isoform X2 n=1 Tax=Tubulanus polymorphus TaxID=672921 RepID=UPI003DA1E7DA
MARLVAVCRSKDYKYEARQLPLNIDESLTMVVHFSDLCLKCGSKQDGAEAKEKEAAKVRFAERFSILTKDEISTDLKVTSQEVYSLLAQIMPCVGCRRSVERLFNQLVESGNPAVEPLVITKGGVLTINKKDIFDSQAIFKLLYVRGPLLNKVIDSIPKSRKNKRCLLHSLDTHKTRSLGTWTEVWDVLSKECREEVLLIDADSLMETLENYLRKHRFCADCKSKVLRAYNILIGEIDSSKEKDYCPTLYDGLKCCPREKHIHVHCDTEFITHIIRRAEPELIGSRRERHAKTLDIAQEEVLTCLGIHLYERLHKIWQKLRAEEQTWQILFCLGVEALKKKFEITLEKKQGISNLELVCEELLEEERVKEQKREQKRQKRRKKRNRNNNNSEEVEGDNCECGVNDNATNTSCASCESDYAAYTVAYSSSTGKTANGSGKPTCNGTTQRSKCEPVTLNCSGSKSSSCRSDAGYSSGHDGCESCSLPSSNDGSDILCSEDHCIHDGESSPCSSVELSDSCSDCSRNSKHCKNEKSQWCKDRPNGDVFCAHGNSFPRQLFGGGMATSLQEMLLEAQCSSDEDIGESISEEEIRQFKANQTILDSKRQELRETLRKRFDRLCLKGCSCRHKNCCAETMCCVNVVLKDTDVDLE